MRAARSLHLLSLACRDHGSLRGRHETASSWAQGVVILQCGGSTLVGLRGRALISMMTFASARIGAVVAGKINPQHHPIHRLNSFRFRLT
jgi:hypothetical protein